MSETEILYRATAPELSFKKEFGSSLILRAGECEMKLDMPATGESVSMVLEDRTQSLKGVCHG